MTHKKDEIIIGNHSITTYTVDKPEALLIQAVDSHDMEEMEEEISYIELNADIPFTLAAIKIRRWNDELTPWQAPPVFGKIPFGKGAPETLDFITNLLVPTLQGERKSKSIILGGYSLSGLFSLWASYNSDMFNAIVAASPSVWYYNWLRYSEQNECKSKSVYLSLGDKESHSKNKLMATVTECIEKQRQILVKQGVKTMLEWNEGNHFTENGKRTAKGFTWCLKSCREQSAY